MDDVSWAVSLPVLAAATNGWIIQSVGSAGDDAWSDRGNRWFRDPLDLLWLSILIGGGARASGDALGPVAFDDPDNYLPLARSLAAGEGFVFNGRPTAYRPPLYPSCLFLWSSCFRGRKQRASRCSISAWARDRLDDAAAARGSASAGAEADRRAGGGLRPGPRMAMSLGDDRDAGRVFAGLGPGRARQQGGWGRCWALGLAWALPAEPAGGGRHHFGRPAGPSGRPPAAPLPRRPADIAVALVLSPWMIRNFAVFGEPVWTTTHGGYTLALANNPVYYRDVLNGPPGRVWTGHEQWEWWDSVNRRPPA